MICFAKPILTEDLYIVQREEFLITCYINVTCTLDERPSIFIRDKPIFSSGRMLHVHKDYCRRGSAKKSLVVILKGLDARTN
jgi:hypothetical protein